jgi:predicted nuclease of predicted toxin-antitoxin system
VLLDAGVPVSVGDIFSNYGHIVIFHRNVLPDKSSDPVVCVTALHNDAILVAIDSDMKHFPKRFGISRTGDRFARLSIIRICCSETLAAHRIQQAMTLIEHEWAFSEEKVARRLWVEIGAHHLRSNR